MNGRVQDAITGRFLSPDPHVQDPGNTQSFNRYSYVNNNPLTYTDPTGFAENPPDVKCTVPSTECLEEQTVTGAKPGSTITPINTGGYGISDPDGGLSFVGTAPRTSTTPSNPAPIVLAINFMADQGSAQYQQCVNAALSGGSGMPNQAAETAGNVADTSAATRAFADSLADSDPASLGRAIAPLSVPGAGVNVSPTNATITVFGEQASDVLQAAGPIVRNGGNFLAGASILTSTYQGYQSNGYSGAAAGLAYSSADTAIGYGLAAALDPVVGIGISVAFNQAGGTRAFVSSAMMSVRLQACSAAAGLSIMPGN